MAKKSRQANQQSSTSNSLGVNSADELRVGEEPVPGVRLRCVCRGHEGAIGRIALSPCGRYLASPSKDKTIRIWDTNDGKCLEVLKNKESDHYCVAWSPDGTQLASGGRSSVSIWNMALPHSASPKIAFEEFCEV
jgi:WD40 repeat protein